MKIAFFVNTFPALSETFILNQITGLLDMGHDVRIFSVRKQDTNNVHEEVVKYDLLNRTIYHRDIVPKSITKRLFKASIILIRNLKHPCIIFRSLNIFKYGTKAAGLSCFFYSDYIYHNKFDIIHCHFGYIGNNYLFLKEILNLKYLTTFHGNDVSRYVKKYGKNVYRKLFNKIDLVTYNSESTKEKLQDMHCPKELMIKLPMGTNLAFFIFKEREISADKEINILSISRLVEKKGLEYAIKSVAELLGKKPNLKINYDIIGEGPLRPDLMELISSLKMHKNIKLFGAARKGKVLEFLAKAHIFIITSITSRDGDVEGQGVVLQEAQASGIPVIATKHNGFPDSIADGETGFLIPEKNTVEIVNKMEYLLDNPKAYNEMSNKGRKFVEERFNMVKLNNRLEIIYKQLLNNRTVSCID